MCDKLLEELREAHYTGNVGKVRGIVEKQGDNFPILKDYGIQWKNDPKLEKLYMNLYGAATTEERLMMADKYYRKLNCKEDRQRAVSLLVRAKIDGILPHFEWSLETNAEFAKRHKPDPWNVLYGQFVDRTRWHLIAKTACDIQYLHPKTLQDRFAYRPSDNVVTENDRYFIYVGFEMLDILCC